MCVQEAFIAFYNPLKGGFSKVGLLSQVTARGQEEMATGWPRGDLGGLLVKVPSPKLYNPWNKLSMEVVESPPLEEFQRDVEESCRDTVYWWTQQCWVSGWAG